MEEVLISRLLEFIPCMHWNCVESKSITFETIYNRLDSVEEQLDICSPYNLGNYSVDWHIGRVKYFVNHPELIDPVSVYDGFLLDYEALEDGNHRFVACVLLGYTTISCYYNGSEEMLKYLKGYTDNYIGG